MFTGNKPRSRISSAKEDDEKFMNVITFDEVTWDNSMWKMETSKAMAILGTKFLKQAILSYQYFYQFKGEFGLHHCQNIRPTENFVSMNLLQISYMISKFFIDPKTTFLFHPI